MKTFVTGATGLLGSNLVQQLLAKGFTVKALVRSRQKAAQVLPDSDSLTLIAWLTERWSAFRKQPALLTVNGVLSLLQKKQVSAAKAQQELAVTFQPLAKTMNDAVQWYWQKQPERFKL